MYEGKWSELVRTELCPVCVSHHNLEREWGCEHLGCSAAEAAPAAGRPQLPHPSGAPAAIAAKDVRRAAAWLIVFSTAPVPP